MGFQQVRCGCAEGRRLLPVIVAPLTCLQVSAGKQQGNKNKFSRTNMSRVETGDSCCAPIASEMERSVRRHNNVPSSNQVFNLKGDGDILLLLMTTAKQQCVVHDNNILLPVSRNCQRFSLFGRAADSANVLHPTADGAFLAFQFRKRWPRSASSKEAAQNGGLPSGWRINATAWGGGGSWAAFMRGGAPKKRNR